MMRFDKGSASRMQRQSELVFFDEYLSTELTI